MADDETAVVIEKGDEVDAAILALQGEAEKICFPELVGAVVREAFWRLPVRPRGDRLELVTGLVEHTGAEASTFSLRGWKPAATSQH